MQRPFGVCWLRFRGCLFLAAALQSFSPVWGQMVLTGSGPAGTVNIFNTDLAVLESGETRKDLQCTVTPTKPIVGFDLRFHAGY